MTLEEILTQQVDEPPAGDEPDAFTVTFAGTDGSSASGPRFELPAGKVGTWEFRVTAAEPIAAGGGFLIQRRGHLVGHRPQADNPRGRDYCTLEVHTSASLRLVVNTHKQHHKPALAVILVDTGTVEPGDSFLLRVGDRRAGGPGSEVSDTTTLARFVAGVDRQGTGNFVGLAASSVDITVTADPRVHLFRVLGPSVVAPGEPFDLHVVAHDINRNVIERHEGAVSFTAPDGVDGVPTTATFRRQDEGVLVVRDVRATKPGLYRIGLRDAASGIEAQSNPIRCEPSPSERIYWGDLHCHSWGDINLGLMTDNSFKLDPPARHRQARRVGRLDFASPGPAVPPTQADQPEVWQAHQAAFREHDAPGSYVPVLAYEVHPPGGPGDRNVIFRDWSDTHLPTFSPLDDVLDAYGDRDDVFLEVHVGGGPANWQLHKTERERLLEIASGHGRFEWFLQRALAHGYRPAVIGSSDTHLPLVGGPISANCFRGRSAGHLNIRDSGLGTGPLAAVRAQRLSREDIWKGISERQTYATTGARILLDVSIDGQPAGSCVSCNAAPTVRIQANACAPIQRIDLIRGDRCVATWRPDTLDVDLEFVEASPLRETWYYVRLRQADSEYAWSTPIWAAVSGGADRPDESLPLWNAHEPLDLAALRPNDAERYQRDLLDYLQREEDPSKFSELTPAGIVDEVPGRAAVFYGYLEPQRHPIMIRWYFEFAMPRLHLDWGWRDFGMADGYQIPVKRCQRPSP